MCAQAPKVIKSSNEKQDRLELSSKNPQNWLLQLLIKASRNQSVRGREYEDIGGEFCECDGEIDQDIAVCRLKPSLVEEQIKQRENVPAVKIGPSVKVAKVSRKGRTDRGYGERAYAMRKYTAVRIPP